MTDEERMERLEKWIADLLREAVSISHIQQPPKGTYEESAFGLAMDLVAILQ